MYACKECGRTFRTRQGLAGHRMFKHGRPKHVLVERETLARVRAERDELLRRVKALEHRVSELSRELEYQKDLSASRFLETACLRGRLEEERRAKREAERERKELQRILEKPQIVHESHHDLSMSRAKQPEIIHE